MTREAFLRLKEALAGSIVGQERLLEQVLIAILADGHLLLEGAPGLAKTTVVKTLAVHTDLDFRRIQFTPDMIPADITGSDMYIAAEQSFRYMQGPIFHHLILADEINRAPPKVQSALLEAMQERQVTVGGNTRSLPEIFMVIATQNPFEQSGTFPLPEAQMDRFLMRVRVDYPSPEDEQKILQHELHSGQKHISTDKVVDSEVIQAARHEIRQVYMDDVVEKYLVRLIDATRHPDQLSSEAGGRLSRWLARGGSPRATLALALTARARAWLNGRDFVDPGDIALLAGDVLSHRLHLSMAAIADQVNMEEVIETLLEVIPVP
ncbi:MAG: AAA family ATPase [Gammaproteobacteria bacterium]|nr:MAG: AAA family ATPase [Gammaproteobacteria bacterium]